MTRRIAARYLALAAVAAASVSCGDLMRENQSSVYLVIDSLRGGAGGTSSPTFTDTLLSDVRTKGSIFNDVGQMSLRISVKDIGTGTNPPDPTLNNEVTINRYRVVYRRADGHNTPGVDVPYPFDGAVTGTIASGTSRTFVFELVRHVAKAESPLAQLASPNTTVITTLTDVTVYGRDQVGNAVSITGTLQVDFGDFADPS